MGEPTTIADQPATSALRASSRREAYLCVARRVAVVTTALLASVILVAWQVTEIGNRLPATWSLMKANTALGLLLSAAVLALSHRHRLYAKFGSAFIVLLALAALLGHLNGTALWINTILMTHTAAAVPGPMSVQTALFFLFMGFPLAYQKHPSRWLNYAVDICVSGLLVMVLVILAGYLFNASHLFGQSPTIRTSPQTLVGMALLVFALFFALFVDRTRTGIYAVLVAPDIGSRFARSALPFVLIVPFLIIAGGTYLTADGWQSEAYSTAMMAVVLAAVLMAFVMLAAWQINRTADILTDTEGQLRLLLDSAGEGIYGLDLDGCATFVNPVTSSMLGFAASELLGRSMHELTHHHRPDGSLYPVADCPMSMALRDGRVHRVDSEVLWRKDGTSFPVEYVTTPIWKDGTLVGAVVIFNDVTERLKTERLKDEFIAVVSHELRTPLTSIKGALGLIASGKLGTLTENGVEMARIACENTQRLELLVNDLLDINKIQLAGASLKMAPVALHDLIDKVLRTNQPYADKSNIEFVRVPDTLGEVRIFGDENRLIQVLTNLLSNAIKYSSTGGQVRVSVREEEQAIRVSVSDDGPGVPLEYQPHVFEKFSQADASDTRQQGGTGLGLAISKEIVERHGGRIGFESTPGQGATFHFDLPLAVTTP